MTIFSGSKTPWVPSLQGAPKEHATGVERSAGVAWPQGIVQDADDDGHASEQARVDGEAARPRARNVWRPQRMKHARTDTVWLHEQEHRGEKRRKHKVEVYIMRPVVQIIQPQIAVATVAKLFSFLSAALASTGFFCYFGVASNSVVLILLASSSSGSLAIMSRNIISGSLRMYCGVVYLLFIGFGLAIGAEAVSHDANGPWWPRTKSLYWAFLTVPIYSLFLSMRNHGNCPPMNEAAAKEELYVARKNHGPR
ncbi:hypothetical protein B0H14DRAFT_3861217 [Mycena olivaceomarginata]|nr:hypothetical protein B0H14DRAFT_3861217 [Mycena olivaceomarginata]